MHVYSHSKLGHVPLMFIAATAAADAGDTRPVETLDELAKGTDVFILQNMGPIEDFDALSYQSKLLIQVMAGKKLEVLSWI